MINFNDWCNSYQNMQKVGIHTSARVSGVCKKVLGGQSLYAEIELYFSKSTELRFISELQDKEHKQAYDEGWLKGAFLGVLDVMLVKPIVPVGVFSCTVKAIRFHEIDSSLQAFRVAGRYATEEFLKQERFIVF